MFVSPANGVLSACVSVSQRNNSDCIYICVMAGKMGMCRPPVLSKVLRPGLYSSSSADRVFPLCVSHFYFLLDLFLGEAFLKAKNQIR